MITDIKLLESFKDKLNDQIQHFTFTPTESKSFVDAYIKAVEELLERYKKLHGDEIITDKDGNSCYVRDLYLSEPQLDEDGILHLDLVGHSHDVTHQTFDFRDLYIAEPEGFKINTCVNIKDEE